jgi:hypothetical protein
MIDRKQRSRYLVDQDGIDEIVNLARVQAERENVTFTGPTDQDVIEVLAAEVMMLREWGMWRLDPDDVQIKAKEMGLKLTADQVRDVRYSFKKGFDAAVENWPEILSEAIEEATKDE